MDGELVTSPKERFFHGDISVQLGAALHNFATEHRLGAVLDSSTGFWMKNRNCRAPDVSFVTRARLRQLGFKRSTREFFPGAPDLSIEILSPNNTRAEIDQRQRDYLESGTQIAWIIDPARSESKSAGAFNAQRRRQSPTAANFHGPRQRRGSMSAQGKPQLPPVGRDGALPWAGMLRTVGAVPEVPEQ